jgi:hypothetical protein
MEWDEDVRQLFAYAGLDYRNAGHWYPMIGLLAELVAPNTIRSPKKTGRKTFWTQAECEKLLVRHDEYKANYPEKSHLACFFKMQVDQPLWYPLRPTGRYYEKTDRTLRLEKARTLARKHRELIRLGHTL